MYWRRDDYGEAFNDLRQLVEDRGGYPEPSDVAKDLLKEFLAQCFGQTQEFRFDQDIYSRTLEELLRFLALEQVRSIYWAPLSSARMARGVSAIQIADDVRIKEMTPRRMAEFWERWGSTASLNDVSDWRCVLELGVSHAPQDHPNWAPLQELAAEVEMALRLAADGPIGSTIIWLRPDPADGPFAAARSFAGGLLRLNRPFRMTGEYVVGRRVEQRVAELLSQHQASTGDSAYDLACRRFNFAYERGELADRMIDYWVAFEALLLPDTDLELAYRAAMRISRFVGQSRSERMRLFKLAKDSYSLRSLIAHGGTLDSKRARKLRPAQLALDTHRLLRQTLTRWGDPNVPHRPEDLDRHLLSG